MPQSETGCCCGHLPAGQWPIELVTQLLRILAAACWCRSSRVFSSLVVAQPVCGHDFEVTLCECMIWCE